MSTEQESVDLYEVVRGGGGGGGVCAVNNVRTCTSCTSRREGKE